MLPNIKRSRVLRRFDQQDMCQAWNEKDIKYKDINHKLGAWKTTRFISGALMIKYYT